MKCAYLGPKGSFSYIAASHITDVKDTLIPRQSFDQLYKLLDHTHVAIIPIENSVTNNVHQNADQLFTGTLSIHKELFLNINLHLYCPIDTDPNTISTVTSHPKALSQCSHYINKHHLQTIPRPSTTEAAEYLIKNQLPDTAVIGPSTLDHNPKLKKIANGIANHQHNLTRFLLISISPAQIVFDHSTKSTYLITLPHQPGSLSRLLSLLTKAGVNLTKIESRPIPGSAFEYIFWLDFTGSPSQLTQAHSYITHHTINHQLIGTYQQGDTYDT